MKSYKHVDRKFAESFRSGSSIKLGTLAYYRQMEGVRSDRLEGAVENQVSYYQTGDDPRIFERMVQQGIFSPDMAGASIVMRRARVVNHAPEGYIFCVSDKPDAELIESGQVAFEISDTEAFYRKLCKCLTGRFQRGRIGPVKYEARENDLVSSDSILPDPFKKDNKFSWEREIRMYFELGSMQKRQSLADAGMPMGLVPSNKRINEDFILVSCKKVSSLIKAL